MAEDGKNGNGNGNGKSVTLGGMKLPIAVIGVIVVQAFGIIWYVANLDSTVKMMQANVTQMQEAATTVDVAVMQTDIVNLKEKIIMIDEMHGQKFDPEPLENDIDALDEELHLAIEKLQEKAEGDARRVETQMDFRIMDLTDTLDQKTEESRHELNNLSIQVGEMRSYVDMRAGEAENSARMGVEELEGNIAWQLEDQENELEYKVDEMNMHIENTRMGFEEGLENIRMNAVNEERLNSRIQDLDGLINYKVDEIRNELDDLRRGLEDQYNERFMGIENMQNFQFPQIEGQLFELSVQVDDNYHDQKERSDHIGNLAGEVRDHVNSMNPFLQTVGESIADLEWRLDEAEEELEDRIRYVETIIAVVENEMRTIMSDHDQFSTILRELGYGDAYADQRQYGEYEEPQEQKKGGGGNKKKGGGGNNKKNQN